MSFLLHLALQRPRRSYSALIEQMNPSYTPPPHSSINTSVEDSLEVGLWISVACKYFSEGVVALLVIEDT